MLNIYYRYPFYNQFDSMDCGPTCLRMIAKYYGKSFTMQKLRERTFISRHGVSLLGISEAAESIGFLTSMVKIKFDQLLTEIPLPCIVHWKQNHFVVVYDIKERNNIFLSKKENRIDVIIADPSHGVVCYKKSEFLKYWQSNHKLEKEVGVALLFEPGPDFRLIEEEKSKKRHFSFLSKYFYHFKRYFIQLILSMVIGSLIQLIFPFLTQAVVDKGIGTRNIGFVNIILIAQFILMISRTSVDFIRNWILLQMSTRINIALISDFLIKLMKLPIGFFEGKLIGDIMQRIGDHQRVQNFLTGSSLSILFSMVNLLIFSIVLAIYNIKILSVFLIGSSLYFLWVWLFMKNRRDSDFKRFAQMANNQSNLYQLVTGIQEIKLNNYEQKKRQKWEQIQTRLYKINAKGLALSQYQQMGALFFNESKNILITFLSAIAVIKGEITLGMMMSIQFIIGQLNAPVDQMILFIQAAQDARLSMERLGEIHLMREEDPPNEDRITIIPDQQDITIDNLSFQYSGPHSEMVLKNVNLKIPAGKITAIVGTSGSGKTTLIKLLLGFYQPINGKILIGDMELQNFNSKKWRSKCGAVLQDGHIFSDTIIENIIVGDDNPDLYRLNRAISIANLKDFIDKLPLGDKTYIGQEGVGISQGQRQRILIARAVYKNPNILFFDEATNALDSNNESTIMHKLNDFFTQKTVIIVAHRYSTVKNADQIIVLEKGEIMENGTHEELIKMRGNYFKLVKNQLELDN